MSAWLAIAGVALGTYVFRVSMFVLLDKRTLPPWMQRPMTLVGPAALAALVAATSFSSTNQASGLPGVELVAIAAGFLAVRRTGNVMYAFVVGMPVLWVLSAVI